MEWIVVEALGLGFQEQAGCLPSEADGFALLGGERGLTGFRSAALRHCLRSGRSDAPTPLPPPVRGRNEPRLGASGLVTRAGAAWWFVARLSTRRPFPRGDRGSVWGRADATWASERRVVIWRGAVLEVVDAGGAVDEAVHARAAAALVAKGGSWICGERCERCGSGLGIVGEGAAWAGCAFDAILGAELGEFSRDAPVVHAG